MPQQHEWEGNYPSNTNLAGLLIQNSNGTKYIEICLGNGYRSILEVEPKISVHIIVVLLVAILITVIWENSMDMNARTHNVELE